MFIALTRWTIQNLEDFENKAKTEKVPAMIPPRRHSLKEPGDEVLGIWSGDEKEADETARKVREQNSNVT